jgi:cytochrome c oxidase subunit 2
MFAVVLWLALTALGEALIFIDLFPVEAAEFAEESDHIFTLLMIIGVPVWAFAVAVVIYAMLQFRLKKPGETGPTWRGTGMVPRIWLIITGALATAVMIHPGLTGLAELQDDTTGYGWGETEAELVIEAKGFQWDWEITYPKEGFTLGLLTPSSGEDFQPMTLPVDTRVRFNISSTDVVHSFWIPAFRMKIDAIPGRTTFITVVTTREGEFHPTSSDSAYRVQCAEFCGGDHQEMYFPIRVVSRAEYDEWVREQQDAAVARGAK